MEKKPKVVIIQKYIPHYRIPFFKNLIDHNKIKDSMDIVIVQGNSNVELNPENAVYAKLWEIKFFGWISLYWQNCWETIINADLVIIEQANKLLFNYFVFVLKPIFGYKIAVWGHGFDHQKRKSNLTNKFKLVQRYVIDWWFAYTNGVKKYLIQSGINEKIITNVQNSLECGNAKNKPIYNPNKNFIGLFVGSMYKAKGISFLINACEKIKEQLPHFEMIFIGDGEDAELVMNFSSEKSWVKYVGKKLGNEKEFYLEMADILLIPQAIGLIVIESFNFQLPIVTTVASGHGPEFEYLVDMKNSLICQNHSVTEYADTVIKLGKTNELLQNLRSGCLKSSEKYTLSKMVDNFAIGLNSIISTK